VIAIVAIDILKDSVAPHRRTPPSTAQEGDVLAGQYAMAAVVYITALVILYKFTHRFTAIFLVLGGALVGQFLFV